MKKKILLIDAANMFFRAYTASPALSTNGHHVGGILGFFYSLQKSIKDIKPHEIFVIWDGQGGSKKRREIRKDYKDGRKPPKPLRLNRVHDIVGDVGDEKISLYYQQHRVIEMLNHLPFIQLCESGIEADDLISFLVSKYSCDDYIKIIISNDKDFIQLTDECTLLYRPAKHEYITYKNHLETEGIHPKNMALSRAIEGDNSDNLSGVKGVGRKTIIKHFPEFGQSVQLGIDELKKMCEQKGDCRPAKSILENLEVVEQNYKIMQLYMPLVTVDAKARVDNMIQDFEHKINIHAFKEEWKKEAVTGASFSPLIEHANKIVRENKK